MNTLSPSSQFSAGMLNALSAHIAVLDQTGQIIAVNEAWRRFGQTNGLVSADSNKGDNYLVVCDQASEKEAGQVAAAIRHILSGQQQEAHIEYLCHSPQEQRWFIAHITRFEANGQPYIIIAHENVSQYKQAELLLRENEQRLKQAQAIAGVGSWVADIPAGTFTASEEAARLVGWAPGTHTLEELMAVIHPDDQATMQAHWLAALAGVPYDIQHRIVRQNQVRWLHVKAEIIFGADGQPVKAIGVTQDITRRKKVEEALQRSENRYRTLTEQIPAIAYLEDVTDVESQILYISPQVEAVLGISQAEWLKNDYNVWVYHIHPEDRERVITVYGACFQDQETFDQEYRMITPDGRLVWIHDQARVIQQDKGMRRLIHGVMHDITAHKQAEMVILEQRQHFLDLFEHSPMATWLEDFTAVHAWMNDLRHQGVTDLAAYLQQNPNQFSYALSLIRVVDVNQAAVEQNAARNKAHLIESLPQLLNQETQVDMVNELLVIWRGETRFEFELNGFRLDGQPLTVLIRLDIPVHEGIPDYSHVIITSSDITQLKQTERALRDSEGHYRELADSIADMFFELDENLHYTYWNKVLERYTGMSADQVMGRHIEDVFPHSNEVKRLGQFYRQVLESGQPASIVSTTGLKGAQHHFDISAYRSQRGVAVLARNVSEWVEARQQLQASEERLAGIVASAMDAIISVDEDHTIVLFNPAAEKMFCCSAQEVIGQSIHQFLPAAYRAAHTEYMRRFGDSLITSRAMNPGDGIQAVRADGTQFPIQASISQIAAAGQRLFTVTLRDITERQQMETALAEERNLLTTRVAERTEALSQANRELARANQLKDEFLSSMSHELRTPLNAILILSESLEEGVYGTLEERQTQTLRTIIESGHHLLALINDILDLSKIEAGKVEMEIELVEIEAICESAMRMVKEHAQQKQIQLEFNLETAAAVMPADPRRLKQILVNLLSNAVKFTPEHGQIGLWVTDEPDGQTIRFTIWDTGIGIAPEQLPRLFKPFVQVDSSLTRQYGGTGLGLALVQRLVTAHRGRVEVKSQLGQGSRFAIILPLSNELVNGDSWPTSQQNKLEHAAAASPSQSHLILLVDDNALSREGLADYLEFLGYRTLVAINGHDALAKAQQSQPDLLIVDIQMPGMDGLELTRRLRATPHFAQTPIIALTAYTMPGDRERCLQAGASHYLAKPIELTLLTDLLHNILWAKDASSR